MKHILPPFGRSRWQPAIGLVLVLGVLLLIVVLLPRFGPLSCDGACVQSVSGADTITVNYTTADNDTLSFTVPVEDERMANAEEGWAWVPRSSLPSALKAVSPDFSAGVVGVGEWALVGRLSATTEQIGPREVTIVAPTESQADPAVIARELSAVTSEYDLEPKRADPVLLIYAPRVLPDKGRMYDRTGYVTTSHFRDGDVSSVWIHEYIHSVQNFETEDEMQWFREASATYLTMRFLGEQYQDVGEPAVRDRMLGLQDSMVCLCNVTACQETNAHYYRGARLLYAIDSEIRRSTNGTHTLVDVFRAMNARDDPISIVEFQALCENASGTDMAWIGSVIQDRDYDLKQHITEIEAFGAQPGIREQVTDHPMAVRSLPEIDFGEVTAPDRPHFRGEHCRERGVYSA